MSNQTTPRSRQSTRKASHQEDEDIGRKNKIHIKKQERTNVIETIQFSTDELQYLIKHLKFTVNPKSPSSNKVLSLSINDSAIPLLQSSEIHPKLVDNLIVQIRIKNIFDAYRFLVPEAVHQEAVLQEAQPLQLEYDHNYSGIKSYYKGIIEANRATSLFEHDNFAHLVKVPIPCSTSYPKDLIPEGLEKYLKDDFILSYHLNNRFMLIKDCLMKHYNPEFRVDSTSHNLSTPYLNTEGVIHPTVIIDDSIPHPHPNKKFIIIGTNYVGWQLVDSLFKKIYLNIVPY